MRMDKTITIMSKGKVSDGIGGWLLNQEIEVASIDAFITPIQVSTLLKEYGIISTKAFKVITFDDVPLKDKSGNTTYLKLEDGSEYKITQLNDYGREKIILAEVM